MTLPEKIGYIFEYYKPALVLAALVLIIAGSIISIRINHKDVLLYIGCANTVVGEDLEHALSDAYIEYEGESPGRSEIRIYRSLYLSRDASTSNHEYAYASQLKTLAAINAGQLDVLFMNREAYDLMSARNYLLPLDSLLLPESPLYLRAAPYLTENTVILKDNEIEHTLDDSIPYQSVTCQAVNGICMNAFPLFENASFSDEVYFGVIGNTKRLPAVLSYLDYLTSDPLPSFTQIDSGDAI